MPIPNVSVKKNAFGAGAAVQSTTGILAICASSTGAAPFYTPAMFASTGLLTSTYPLGPLPEDVSYTINVAGFPVVTMRSNPTVAGTYGTITHTIAGTATVAAGGTTPIDYYGPVTVTIVNGGALGTTGITYTYSLDGVNTSTVQALGTALTLTIPNTGISFTLSTTASTFVAGDTWTVYCEGPQMNNTDLATALAALGNTRLPWEGAYFDCQYLSGTVGLIDTWLAGRETSGQFNFALINTRYLNDPTPGTETPAAYATAMITLTGGDTSNRMCVGADGGHVVSLITGVTQKRPTALALGAMAMSLTPNIGTDPAFVGNGPVPGYTISKNGNPNDWDEAIYQSLDSQRLTTLRSFAPGGPTGTYITNANVLITAGSNITWLQLLRILNRACSIAWQVLNTQLSNKVRTVLNTSTGALNIDERDAQSIDSLVNAPLSTALSGQVTDVAYRTNRDDNLTTQGSPVNGVVQIQAEFYIKGFVVTVGLVKVISATGAGG